MKTHPPNFLFYSLFLYLKHQVKESKLIVGECYKVTKSNEQTTIMSLNFQKVSIMEEMSLAKAISDEDDKMYVLLSTTITTKESDKMIKTIKEEHSCCDKIKATIIVKITKTSLEEA
jgi:hypothetical protein